MSDLIVDGDTDCINPYLRYLADQMGLRDWFFYRGHATPQDLGRDDDVAAMCDASYGRKRATIYFRADWADMTEEEFRTMCVHELLHCHFNSIATKVDMLQALLGELVFAVWKAAINEGLELCLDGIAYEWGRRLPLPSAWLEQATEPEGEAA